MNEEDLRVQRTRKLLGEALVTLVLEKGFENITIRDVTRQAQVGYKTFFRHYESLEALLQTIVYQVLAEFESGLLPPDDPEAPKKNTLYALRFACQHRKEFLTVVQSPISKQLIFSLRQLSEREGISTFSGSGLPDELVAYHFGASMFSLIQWWLEQETPFDEEVMAGYIDKLLIEPIKNLQ